MPELNLFVGPECDGLISLSPESSGLVNVQQCSLHTCKTGYSYQQYSISRHGRYLGSVKISEGVGEGGRVERGRIE